MSGRAPAKLRRSRPLLAGLLWTAPWWLGFLIFLALPMGLSLYISFCDYPLLQPPVWTGLANYRALGADTLFHKTVANTFIYAVLAIPLGTIVAVLLAVLLNRPVRGIALFRACVFLPSIVPIVAVAIVWLWLLNPEHGLVNAPARLAGGQGPLWLASPLWAQPALVLVALWTLGSPVVIYLAGLQDIPEELYEAARLDGASRIGQFRHVTLPGLGPVILFNVIVGIIGTWQIFALPFVLWAGNPRPDLHVYFYTMYLFDNAFRYLKMGYASAMAWVQLLIILGLTGLVFLVSRRAVHYRGA